MMGGVPGCCSGVVTQRLDDLHVAFPVDQNSGAALRERADVDAPQRVAVNKPAGVVEQRHQPTTMYRVVEFGVNALY